MSRAAVGIAISATFSTAAVMVYLGLVWTMAGQRSDASGFALAGVVEGSLVKPVLGFVRSEGVVVLAIGAVVCGLLALHRHRWRPVLAGVILVLVSVAVCRVLREVLPRPFLGDFAYRDNTMPSGHAAAAAALVVALCWLIPFRRRWLRVTAVILVAGIGWTSVLTFAHRTGDVLCSILIVGALGAVIGLIVPGAVDTARGTTLWPAVALSGASVVALAAQAAVSAGPAVSGLAGLGVLLAAAWWLITIIGGPWVAQASAT